MNEKQRRAPRLPVHTIRPGREQPHITPGEFVEYALARRGLARTDAGVGTAVIMSWVPTEDFIKTAAATAAPLGMYQLQTGGSVSLLHAHVGAPGAVAQVEEMAALGARAVLGVGLCGSLQPDLPVGSLVIAGESIRDEGTSHHYLGARAKVGPTARAVAALRQAGADDARLGRHWTTDAPYRETRDKIRRHVAQGVTSVDMEASAIYAVARCRRLETAMLLVVSDELWREPWRPAFHEVAAVTGRALEIAWRAAQILAATPPG